MAQNIEACLKDLAKEKGFIAAAVVDSNSGMALGTIGGGTDFPIEVGAAANTEVVLAKLRAAESLGLEDSIEDILITLTTQYHLIRPLQENPSVFIYIALNRAQSNLALARHAVANVEKRLKIS